MILILSDGLDKTTDDVLQYLKFYKLDFIRINDYDIINDMKVVMKEEGTFIFLKIGDIVMRIEDIKTYWYRRGKFNFNFFNQIDKDLLSYSFYIQYIKYLNKEYSNIEQLIHYKLSKLKRLNSYYNNFISKFTQFQVALEVGFV